MAPLEVLNSMTPLMALTVLMAGGMAFFYEWRKSKEREFELRQLEMKRQQYDSETHNKIVVNNETQSNNADLGGYVTIDIPEDKKPIFHDILKGFEEYAQLKGYKVSLSIDTGEPGKISFKIVVIEFGVTSTRKTINADLDEYIEEIKNGAHLDDLPEVLNPLEHSRIIMALKNRITFLQQNYEIEKNIKEFYQGFFEKLPIHGISHSSPVFNITNGGKTDMDQRKYIANNTANVMQGDNHGNTLTSGEIMIGASFSEKKEQLQKLELLIEELRRGSDSGQSQGTIRHLENVKEELEQSEKPDTAMIGKWLGKAGTILNVAEKGSALFEKAKGVFDSFGIQF
jgi:hypothetical protein